MPPDIGEVATPFICSKHINKHGSDPCPNVTQCVRHEVGTSRPTPMLQLIHLIG